MVILDMRGNIVLVNSQLERLFERTRDDVLGQSVEILMPERFRGAHQNHRSGYFSDMRVRPMGSGLELSGMRRDGSEFPVEISLSPLVTEAGTFAIAAIRDITERKRAERKFRDLLESAPDAMVVVDSDGVIELVNSQFERMFGYDRSEAIGQPIELFVPKRFRKKHVGHRKG